MISRRNKLNLRIMLKLMPKMKLTRKEKKRERIKKIHMAIEIPMIKKRTNKRKRRVKIQTSLRDLRRKEMEATLETKTMMTPMA